MNIPPFTGAWRDDNQNLILYEGDPQSFPKNLDVSGCNNQIGISEATDLSQLEIIIGGNDNVLYIGLGNRLSGEINIMGHNQTVQIGNDNVFDGVKMHASESTNIRIGNDCMFATGIEIRTSDSHELICLTSRQRVNPPGSILIGHHVCIEKNVTINKSVTIASNSIVGAHSFVNQSFEQENVMIVGTPARIVRENVHWNRPRPSLK